MRYTGKRNKDGLLPTSSEGGGHLAPPRYSTTCGYGNSLWINDSSLSWPCVLASPSFGGVWGGLICVLASPSFGGVWGGLVGRLRTTSPGPNPSHYVIRYKRPALQPVLNFFPISDRGDDILFQIDILHDSKHFHPRSFCHQNIDTAKVLLYHLRLAPDHR